MNSASQSSGIRRGRAAFTLTELLVVMGVIVLLLGVLLVGLRSARESARVGKTRSIMFEFAGACESFKLVHGSYPGIVPERILASHNHEIIHGGGGIAISSTENAILHLMGGAVRESDVSPSEWVQLSPATGWKEYSFTRPAGAPLIVKINANMIGAGPTIAQTSYSPYLAASTAIRPSDNVFDQWGSKQQGGDDSRNNSPASALPDLVDGWGRPILYVRQARNDGRLAGDAHPHVDSPQFYVDSLWPYTRSSTQTWRDPCDGHDGGSLLNSNYFTGDGSGVDPSIERRMLAMIMRSSASNADPTSNLTPGDARSAFALISAGSDGVYFASNDGPGNPAGHIGSSCGDGIPINEFLHMGPTALDTFDDVRHYGGAP